MLNWGNPVENPVETVENLKNPTKIRLFLSIKKLQTCLFLQDFGPAHQKSQLRTNGRIRLPGGLLGGLLFLDAEKEPEETRQKPRTFDHNHLHGRDTTHSVKKCRTHRAAGTTVQQRHWNPSTMRNTAAKNSTNWRGKQSASSTPSPKAKQRRGTGEGGPLRPRFRLPMTHAPFLHQPPGPPKATHS